MWSWLLIFAKVTIRNQAQDYLDTHINFTMSRDVMDNVHGLIKVFIHNSFLIHQDKINFYVEYLVDTISMWGNKFKDIQASEGFEATR